MNFSQEKWNLILDLKDIVERLEKDNARLNRVITSQEDRIKKLEERKSDPSFNDIFGQCK